MAKGAEALMPVMTLLAAVHTTPQESQRVPTSTS